jgi:hypothetical protein
MNYAKEPNKAHKNTVKEEITEKFMEMLLDKLNQKYKRHSKNSKRTK